MINEAKYSIKKDLTVLIGVENLWGHFFINNFDIDSIVVDLGACKGDFSRMLLERCHCSKIILIEPNPLLIPDLKLTFKHKKNVKILNAAVGARSADSVKFYVSENIEASSLNKSFAELYGLSKNQYQFNIRRISLKDIFSFSKLKKIDLLKMDIEGGEWDVFENFSKAAYERIDQISVEFHDFNNPLLRKRTERCIKKLQKLGYLFIHEGSIYRHGTPYANCLFFKTRLLRKPKIINKKLNRTRLCKKSGHYQ